MNLEQIGTGVAAHILESAERVFGFLGGDNFGGGGDAHGEGPCPLEAAVDPGVALIHRGIDDASYAVAVAQGLAIAHAVGEILVGRHGHEALGPVGGVFMQHAGGLAIGIQNKVAIFRIGRAAHQAHRFATLGIQAGVMAIAGHDVAGPVGHGGVENMTVEILVVENSRKPTNAIHPGARMGCRKVGHGLLHLGDGRNGVKFSALAMIVAAVLQMDVGVLKAGQDEAAAGIDDAGQGARECGNFRG
jgi:hypothetical protein